MSLLVRTVFNKSWIPYENKVEYYLDEELRQFSAPVTTVHGFFFDKEGRILLVRHSRRGWEVPGGHVEAGEDFESAMRRELWEESQVKCGELRQLGYLKKIAIGEKPENCVYPYPESYCLFYTAKIKEVSEFCGDEFICEVGYYEREAAAKVGWLISYKEYFEAACRVIF